MAVQPELRMPEQSTIGDVTGAEEGFEFRRSEVHTAPPVFQRTGLCFSRNGQSGECTSQQASSETRKHGTTNKHVNKKLALNKKHRHQIA